MAQKKITDLSLRSDFDTTCNLPADDSTATFRVTGAQILTWLSALRSSSGEVTNLSLTAAVATSALTIAVKSRAGSSNPSATDPINVGMRSATSATGTYATRQITGALSLVVSSGSTLGHRSAIPAHIYVYLIDNAGTLELAVSSTKYDDGSIVTTVAEGGAGAADSSYSIYSTTQRTGVAIRYIGRFLSTQATAGTWAAVPSEIALFTQPKIFRMGAYLAVNGSRVTAPPAALGEYRCLIRTGSGSNNVSDNAPGAGPSDANGMRIYSKAYNAAGTSGETNRWEIFVGRNKKVDFQFFASAARTGNIDTAYQNISTTIDQGIYRSYDPTTGIVQLDAMVPANGSSSTFLVGLTLIGNTITALTDCYFDLVISDLDVA